MKTVTAAILLFAVSAFAETPRNDFLTPAYYHSKATPFKQEAEQFLTAVHRERFHHPLDDGSGNIPEYMVPIRGRFCAEKGRRGPVQYHPATDLHIGSRKSDVLLYAAHDGKIAAVRNARKYRQYLSITKEIKSGDGTVLGKLVTLYGHVDLDLDEADGLDINGKTVKKGALISKHLYAGTRGGPHLHFEIRYYRPADSGNEEFYGFAFPGRPTKLTERSTGGWKYGFWNPDTGYGFGYPRNHGLSFY